MRANHLPVLRYHACRAQGGLCFYCRQPMGRNVTAEHLRARSDGGPDTHENIVAACRYCNLQRHARFAPNAPDPSTYGFYVLLMLAAGLWMPDKSGTSTP